MRVRFLLLLFFGVSQVAAQPLAAPNAIPVFFTEIPPHKFATQFNFSAGTGRIAEGDKALLSPSIEVKGMYNTTGAIYLSTGAGFTFLHSQQKALVGIESPKRDAWLFYFPSGVGFTMGDDNASIITGVDVLPGFYIHPTPKQPNQRVFALGLGPELGFLFRAGPKYSKGLLIGLVGKVQFMQRSNLDEGPAFHYTYGGMGIVIRFY
jgi:hypothetical protein